VFAPGDATALELDLDRLPATLRISASRAGAVVSVDGIDVGAAPLDLSRPAGT
jgi:PEGA domain